MLFLERTEMFSSSFNVFLDFCSYGLVFNNLTIYPMDYWWNSYHGVVVSLFLFNCIHVGFTQPSRLALKVQHSELKHLFVVLLYAIQSVMVREMLNEINIHCISKTFVQAAFGPKPVYVLVLWSFLLVMTPTCIDISLRLYCLIKVSME